MSSKNTASHASVPTYTQTINPHRAKEKNNLICKICEQIGRKKLQDGFMQNLGRILLFCTKQNIKLKVNSIKPFDFSSIDWDSREVIGRWHAYIDFRLNGVLLCRAYQIMDHLIFRTSDPWFECQLKFVRIYSNVGCFFFSLSHPTQRTLTDYKVIYV